MSSQGDDMKILKRSLSPTIEQEEGKKRVRTEESEGLDFQINAGYSQNTSVLHKIFADNDEKGVGDASAFVRDNCHMVKQPFKVMELNNFVQDGGCLDKLKDAISSIELKVKNNDLYSYNVSDEIGITDKRFAPLLKFLRQNVSKFLEEVTEEKLNSQISVTVSRYDQTDYLLCHDDQLEGRRIAFVWYFVDSEWSDKDGGQLELFNTDPVDFQPLEIVERLTPKANTFNFFVVGPNTYHQVSEVLTDRSPRWSINGWFHSDSATIVPRNYSFPLVTALYNPLTDSTPETDISYELLMQWIDPRYVTQEFQGEIRQMFTAKSEIQLMSFFRLNKFEELKNALEDDNNAAVWKEYLRPAYAKFCHVDEQSDVAKPQIIVEALRLFRSEAFFLLLSQLTGVGLHKGALKDIVDEHKPSTSSSATAIVEDGKPELVENAVCRGEVRRWRKGDYSLASNESPDFKEVWGLDVMLFLNHVGQVKPLMEVFSDNLKTSNNKNNNDDTDEDADDEEDDGDFEMSNRDLHNSESDASESENSDASMSEQSDEDDDDDEENTRNGGYIVYIDDESSEELMSFTPVENCLNVVYRLKGTQRFMKYVNSTSPLEHGLHEIAFVYTDGDQYKP